MHVQCNTLWNTLCLAMCIRSGLSGSFSPCVSACSSVDDRYASLRETASTHSVLSVGVSCFQRKDEVEMDMKSEGCTTWSVSTFSILLLSQVTIRCVELSAFSCMQGDTFNFTHE